MTGADAGEEARANAGLDVTASAAGRLDSRRLKRPSASVSYILEGKTAMATWKRLTSTDRQETYVNVEQIAYMQRDEGHTVVIFAVATIDGVCSVKVTETPNQILDALPLHSAHEQSQDKGQKHK